MLWRTMALLTWLVGGVDGGRPAQAPALRYLALGDSFTIGTGQPERLNFPSQLAAMLERRGRVVRLTNVAVNGYSTRELLAEELPALEVVKPTHVTLAIGANDLVRGASSAEYRARLRQIFARLARSGVTGGRLLVLPQPDWSQAPVAEAFGDRETLRRRIEASNAVLAEETTAAGGVFVDLWPLFVAQGAQRMFADDGLHPSGSAYTAWAQALVERFDPG
ncbi:MAG: SGNH/GDSL hydrolase family protein [Myxococcaceae bacterium]|nr:SGNH/GDSL hydrolase family protein [Myxococcaceae bacterium]MCA3016651.1 SGNH/GDSL hydrolase family protein [Myxococcaceae bacterium]